MAEPLWPFAAYGAATELLEWRTDVLQSEAGEQRLTLRAAPREVLTLRHRLDGRGLTQAMALARRGTAGDWIVPLWQMAERLGVDILAWDTSVAVSALHADYREPGYAVAAMDGGPAHLLEVAAVRPDRIDLAVSAGLDLTRPVVAPARRARLLAPLEIARRHAGLGTVTARFLLLESADLSGLRSTALYIAIDASNSMAGEKSAAAMAAVRALVMELVETVPPALRNDLCIVLWNETVSGMRLLRDAGRQELADLAAWLTEPPLFAGATDFEVALSEAPAFFDGAGAKRRLLVFLTDGEPYPASSVTAAVALRDSLTDVEVHGINLGLEDTSWTAMIDNTPTDGVPVIAPGETEALRDHLMQLLLGVPRYRGRDVLMDPAVLRQPLAETLSQPVEAVDSALGPVVFEPLRDLVQRGTVLTLKDIGLAQTWPRRRWLHRGRGRTRAFWLPTWGREIALQQEGTPGDNALFVASGLDPADFIDRHVLLDLDGAPLFLEITSAAYDPMGLRLGIAPLERTVPITTHGHLMTLVRLDTDRIELEHRPAGTEIGLTIIETSDAL